MYLFSVASHYKKSQGPGRHGTQTSTRRNFSGCVVPGLVGEFVLHPLSLAFSTGRLHVDHHFIKIDELGRAGKGAATFARFCRSSAHLQASGNLNVTHNTPQVLVGVSLECLDLRKQWWRVDKAGGGYGEAVLDSLGIMVTYGKVMWPSVGFVLSTIGVWPFRELAWPSES